ncbi:antibiotic biosynthesis monooxygenase family protein [Thioclava sp. FR2]|uniref:antibiotic biosynthesis monooxygenase family protein n=1 Tax=Thioclava sp. FR2 TaxID=3445780 RepID=UPI003EBB2EE2
MYARVTEYKMKPGTREAATERLNTMKSQIMGMKGMQHFLNVMNEDGTGYVISVVDSEESSKANAEAVKAAWGKMAEFLEAMPTPKGFDVIADWS